MKNIPKSNDKQNVSRRDFIKIASAGTVAAAVASIPGCKPQNSETNQNSNNGEVPKGKMTYRTNQKTGDKVSLLGYGCMRFPMIQDASGKDVVDQETVNKLVDYAIEHGINYFDTAPVYLQGQSETATGIALKRHPRDKFFIATKLSNHREGIGRTLKGGIEMYHNSLKNLQVDYIDYYLLHNVGGGGMPVFSDRYLNNGLLDFIDNERKEKRIRNLGWSFHGDVKVFDYLLSQHDAGKYLWDFVMIQLNYVDWLYADADGSGRNTNAQYLLGELEKRNIQAVIMEPLLGGRLARISEQGAKLMAEMHPEDNSAEWAFRYAGSPESILTVLSGMVYMEHLQDNIRTYSPFKSLNDAEYKLLAKVAEIMTNDNYIQCTECEYCMPCPYGLDIPRIFAHYNRIISSGQMLKNSNDENYKEARRAFLVGYDRTVPKLRQASHCTNCDVCKPRCPQSLEIPDELLRIDLYAERLKQSLEF